MERPDKRKFSQIRPHKFTKNFVRNPRGSVLIECGNTRVICTASVEHSAPRWMKEQGKSGGWITAEYQMMPGSGGRRIPRRSNGRATEIQRLIGRSLRAAVDLALLGNNTITIDCDVLDADGGTRCASINGGLIALRLALNDMFVCEEIPTIPMAEFVGAISVGIVEGIPMSDLCYEEDSSAAVDMNVVMTESGRFIEIQGTAEKEPFTIEQMNAMLNLANGSIGEIITLQRECLSVCNDQK
jgi:ribonuclease PH